MPKPFLSVGLIVKNEIRCIEKCLKALQPLRDALPCEVIVADTGSDDGTRQVAERYADEVFDFPWVDDFAAARNAVMERCHGKWYFTVDADEYLDPDFHELVQLSRLAPKEWPETLFVNQRNYNFPDLEHGEYTDFIAQRLARLDMGIHYEGSIHECFSRKDGSPIRKAAYLSGIVLHHDGYALESPEARKKKSERNLELLDRELEQNPEDLRRLNQCIEAAGIFPVKQAAYAVRSMEILFQNGEKQADISAPGTAAHCALVAASQNLPQAEEWIHWSKEHYPDHVTTRIDTAYAEILLDYRQEEYECLPELAEQFVKDSGRLQRKEFPKKELIVGNLSANGIGFVRKVKVIEAIALCKTGRKEEGLALLRGWPLAELSSDSMDDWLKGMRQCADQPGAAKEMRRALDLIPLRREDAEDSKWEKEQSNQFRVGCLLMFLENSKEKDGVQNPWQVFLESGGPLGAAAGVLSATEREDAERALAQTDAWRDFPPVALEWAFTLGCRFPESLYTQGTGILRNIIADLAKKENFSAKLLDWMQNNPASSLAQHQFLWQMLAGAMQKKESFSHERLGLALCDAFYHETACYYRGLYHPNVLAEPGEWDVLPKMGRFSMHYLQARKALEQGDQLGYVRELRAGLKQAPLMKQMVSFLLETQEKEEKKEAAASPAIMALAEQVQAILARYSPDDPAVADLKQSEAYRKVAWILEKAPAPTAAPWEPAAPELEQAFAALADTCRFSSEEQARKAIESKFQSIQPGSQQILVDYWRRFPLWGDGPDQVLDHIAHAFYTHWEDFDWIYHRLMDDRSRRTLLAVLRNWRSFEMAPLTDVIDKRYDDYFDREVLFCGGKDVVADLGAFTGDTFLSYVKNYGADGYRRYYCYEITPNSYRKLLNATGPYPFVVCRRKGVGAGPGEMFLSANSDTSANSLERSGQERVEIVALDDDISEPLTLIKMDIEGAEQGALAGCARHIREDRPKLALSVYHNFEDLWKLPRMIEDLVPGYRFYFRYHGGDLWPSEITLLALPPLES